VLPFALQRGSKLALPAPLLRLDLLLLPVYLVLVHPVRRLRSGHRF
jgi:hypothetical protein